MRRRAVLIVALIAVGITPALTGWSAPEATQATQRTQNLSEPLPPHRLMAVPVDAAVLDVASVAPMAVTTQATSRWAQGKWTRFTAKVQRSALCIAHHESWRAGLWRALNSAGSTASGFAQWINSTWRTQTRRAHIGTRYARAYLAPPAVQAAVFAYQAMHHGLYPWRGTNCPGTT